MHPAACVEARRESLCKASIIFSGSHITQGVQRLIGVGACRSGRQHMGATCTGCLHLRHTHPYARADARQKDTNGF